jgi:hypothetical protein
MQTAAATTHLRMQITAEQPGIKADAAKTGNSTDSGS